MIGVDLAANEVELTGGVSVALLQDDDATSVEFDLIVERLNEAGKVVESEAFSGLGIDPSHTSYAPKIVGAFDRASGEPEETGTSEMIRISDLTKDDAGVDIAGAAGLRLSRWNRTPYDGVTRTLSGGSDDLATIDDIFDLHRCARCRSGGSHGHLHAGKHRRHQHRRRAGAPASRRTCRTRSSITAR